MYDPLQHDSLIQSAGEKHGISPNILWGLLQQESGGRPRQGPATDNFGNPLRDRADGYFQFTDETARRYGVARGNFASEVDGAARYLADLKRVKGDEWGALSAYGGHIKADPTPYIDGVIQKSMRSPFLRKDVPQSEVDDLDAQIMAKITQPKGVPNKSEGDVANAAAPVINPDSKRSPLGRPAAELSDEEILDGVGFLVPMAGGIAGGIAGSAVGAATPVPGGAIAGGAVGGGMGTGAAVYWKIKDKYPDIDEERARRIAAKEGLFDAALSGAIGVGGKAIMGAKKAGVFSPVEEYMAKLSGKVPKVGGGAGSVAGRTEYQNAATIMNDAIENEITRVRGDIGTIDDVGGLFVRSRKEAADTARELLGRQYKQFDLKGPVGSIKVPVRTPDIDAAYDQYQKIKAVSPTLLTPKIDELVAKIRPSAPGAPGVRDMGVAYAVGLRREIDQLLDWDAGGDLSREAADKVLRPLREALNKSVIDGLSSKGHPIEAANFARINKEYGGMIRSLNDEYLVKVAQKDPKAIAKFIGSRAGTYGFEDLEGALKTVQKYVPGYTKEMGEQLLNAARQEYIKTNFADPKKITLLGEVLAKPSLDPDMYKTFNTFFKGNLYAKNALEDAAKGAKSVSDFVTRVNEAGRVSGTQGAVYAPIALGGAVAGSTGSIAAAGLVSWFTGIYPRMMARAATDGNKEVLSKGRWIGKWASGIGASSAGAGANQIEIPDRIHKMMQEMTAEYGGTDGQDGE